MRLPRRHLWRFGFTGEYYTKFQTPRVCAASQTEGTRRSRSRTMEESGPLDNLPPKCCHCCQYPVPVSNALLATLALELATLPHHDLRLDRQSAKRDGGSLGEGGWQHSKPSRHRHGDQSPPPMFSCTSGCPDESSWFVTVVNLRMVIGLLFGNESTLSACSNLFELVS